jgi:hypothetical protein
LLQVRPLSFQCGLTFIFAQSIAILSFATPKFPHWFPRYKSEAQLFHKACVATVASSLVWAPPYACTAVSPQIRRTCCAPTGITNAATNVTRADAAVRKRVSPFMTTSHYRQTDQTIRDPFTAGCHARDSIRPRLSKVKLERVSNAKFVERPSGREAFFACR